MGAKHYSEQTKALAGQFYVKGWTVEEIASEMTIDARTLYNWKKAYGWDEKKAESSAEQVIAQRICVLANRENKTPGEIAEQASLCATFGNLKIQLAQAEAIKNGRYQSLAPVAVDNGEAERPLKSAGQKKAPREKKAKNDISSISEEMIMSVLHSEFYAYQLKWWEAMNNPDTRRNRFILKSRQIGATYYFAFEAFADAILTGGNQIFLSASHKQVDVFKAYIIAFALKHFEVEIKGGDVMTLSNGAKLIFLSTNSRTAQSHTGNLYVDECFWIPKFEEIYKVASGMALHKKWRRTLFSTPSALSHQAYPKWSGETHNKKFAVNKRVEFDVSHKALKDGALGPDRTWRHMVTLLDAEEQGCDLFDVEEVRAEYSTEDFKNLCMCGFIDDANSVFNLSIMTTCYAQEDYTDYNDKAPRPYGNRPVAIGYDPSRTRDNASLAILAIPLKPGDKWRVLQTLDYHGQNFQYQANRIKEICDSHNVQHIGIDITGIGYGLFELVEQFYRRATPINYSNETKTRLVMKAIDVIENGRFEYECGNKQITQAFMMITKTTTSSGGAITYAAGRNNATGHADVAWSIMHALAYEPIAVRQKTTVSMG